MSEIESLWTFEDVRKYLRKTKHAMRWLMRQRRIPMIRISGRYYFDPEDIRKWIKNNKVKPIEKGGENHE